MRRRPMQPWPRGRLKTGGSRAIFALAVFALLAMLVPSSAAADPPAISYSIDGIAGTNGWWRGSTHGNYVVLHWTVNANPPLTNSVGCDPAIAIPGPTPAAGVTKTCTATNDNGNSYESKTITIRVDANPPVLSNVAVTSRAGSDLVHWTSTSPADTAVVQRWARGNSEQPIVFRGATTQFVDKRIQAGLEYEYAIQTTDQAGNPSQKVIVAGLPRVLTLRKMSYVPRAAPNPILRWTRTRGASYYHVQLFRGSRRIYAAWPSARQLVLPTTWKWAGHRYRLKPGKYRWYAWAGIGRRSFAKYDRIGSARFIVPPG
jgi:hypothetical protein